MVSARVRVNVAIVRIARTCAMVRIFLEGVGDRSVRKSKYTTRNWISNSGGDSSRGLQSPWRAGGVSPLDVDRSLNAQAISRNQGTHAPRSAWEASSRNCLNCPKHLNPERPGESRAPRACLAAPAAVLPERNIVRRRAARSDTLPTVEPWMGSPLACASG